MLGAQWLRCVVGHAALRLALTAWVPILHVLLAGTPAMDGQPSGQLQESALQALMVAVASLYAFLQANLTGCATQANRPSW